MQFFLIFLHINKVWALFIACFCNVWGHEFKLARWEKLSDVFASKFFRFLNFQFIFWLRRKFSISKIIAFTNEKSSFFLEKIKTRYFSKNVAKKWSKKEEKKTPKNAFWKILYTLCRAYVGYTEGIQRVYRWDAEKPFLKYMGFKGILATFRIIIFAI